MHKFLQWGKQERSSRTCYDAQYVLVRTLPQTLFGGTNVSAVSGHRGFSQ